MAIRFSDTKGEKHPNAKFTRAQIDDIRRRHAAGEKPREILKDYPQTTVGYLYQLTTRHSRRWMQ